MKTVYITTAIDYINARPHLGHAYEKIGADVAARYQRLKGRTSYLLTGSDEHSLNILKNARKQEVEPGLFCDGMVRHFKDLYKLVRVDHFRFIRTSDSDHRQVVQTVIKRLWEKGYIRRGIYSGHYCESCEAFIEESALQDGSCPYHPGKAVVWIEEENFFFTLNRFQERLSRLYREEPGFLQPDTWRKEIVNRLESGLKDISISRSGTAWGIPFPDQSGHVVYVWFDALLNYLTGAGFGLNEALFETIWPPDLQIVGKDITWFHGIIWPAILMALDLPLPKRIFAHGHLLQGGQKLSKSAGIVIDPLELAAVFDADIIRYYLMKAIPWGSDGNFSYEGIVTTVNNDLANDYGNLISRTEAMIEKFNEGIIPGTVENHDPGSGVEALANQVILNYHRAMDALGYPAALESVLELVRSGNKYIEATAPWQLAMERGQRERLEGVLYHLAEVIRLSTLMLEPFMPSLPGRVWPRLGVDPAKSIGAERMKWGYCYQDVAIRRDGPLFPRLELGKIMSHFLKNQ